MKLSAIIIKLKLHHLLFWCLLFLGWHYFRYQDYPSHAAIPITLIKVADLAILVYITNYVLIPRLLYKKRYLWFGLVFIVMVVTSSIIKLHWISYLLNPSAPLNVFDRFKTRVYDNVFPHILLVCTGAAFKLLLDHARAQKNLVALAKEKSEAELQFLKSQINPHFLFNSLNSVYFLIDKQNTVARETLLQFSDLLRYQLYDCNADTIEIEKEITYLKDYVRLQQLRRDQHYEVTIEGADSLKGFSITPLLLIPFVENAFKHISHSSEHKNFVHIDMSRQNGSFHFSVINSKDHHRSTEPRGGIGLANVKRRLELLYPDRHVLHVSNENDTFKVALALTIQN